VALPLLLHLLEQFQFQIEPLLVNEARLLALAAVKPHVSRLDDVLLVLDLSEEGQQAFGNLRDAVEPAPVLPGVLDPFDGTRGHDGLVPVGPKFDALELEDSEPRKGIQEQVVAGFGAYVNGVRIVANELID
jgi:hypothetical protein